MKKKLLFACLLASVVLLPSCVKDDMELLKHPYRVQGELSPCFGLPVISSGQLNLNDLLLSFDGTFTGLITDDNTITFHYADSVQQTLHIGGMITKGKYAPTKRASQIKNQRKLNTKRSETPFISRDTVISYTIPIDLFDKADLQDIVNAGIAINELNLSLSANVNAVPHGGEDVEGVLDSFVRARFDNVMLRYTGHDYQSHSFSQFASQSLVIESLIQGGEVNFDSINLAQIINDMPRSITASFHMHVEVDSGLVQNAMHNFLTDTSAITSFSILLDSLKMTELTFGVKLEVFLPFEIRIGGLAYSYDLALQGNGEGESSSIFDALDTTLNNLLGEGAVSLDSSKVSAILKFSNGIPLDLTLNGTLVDANGGEYALFTHQKIASAVTGPVEGRPGVEQAIRDSASLVELPLTVEGLEKLTQAQKLRLRLVLATSDATSFKTIKRDDYLKVKMMVRLNPSILIDMQVFEGFDGMLDGIPIIGDLLNNNN